MLEHLVQADALNPEITDPGNFVPLERATTDAVLAAKIQTTDWLDEMGVKSGQELASTLEQEAARNAFQAIALSPQENTPEQKAALAALKTPPAVRHLTGMLSAYDWEFIEQAKELRGYTVAQLVELTQDRNPNIRLKALGLLGKVTEVGLFTEKIEVKKQEASDEELDQRIKDKLNKFMGVVDALSVTDIADAEEKPAADDSENSPGSADEA